MKNVKESHRKFYDWELEKRGKNVLERDEE